MLLGIIISDLLQPVMINNTTNDVNLGVIKLFNLLLSISRQVNQVLYLECLMNNLVNKVYTPLFSIVLLVHEGLSLLCEWCENEVEGILHFAVYRMTVAQLLYQGVQLLFYHQVVKLQVYHNFETVFHFLLILVLTFSHEAVLLLRFYQ